MKYKVLTPVTIGTEGYVPDGWNADGTEREYIHGEVLDVFEDSPMVVFRETETGHQYTITRQALRERVGR